MHIKIGILNSSASLSERSIDAIFATCNHLSLFCTLLISNTSEYGDVSKNGDGTGITGAIQRGIFDTFQPIFTPTPNRMRAIDFSEPIFYEDFVLATRFPDNSPNRLSFGIVTALKWQTWLAFIFCLVATSSFIVLSSKRLLQIPDLSSRYWPIALVVAIVEYLPALITHKHRNKDLKFLYIRVACVAWSLGAMILASAYTSILFSEKFKQTIDLPYKDFETFTRCLEENRCRLIVHELSASYVQTLTGNWTDQSRRLQAIFSKSPILIRPNSEIPNVILEDHRKFLVWIDARSTFEQNAGHIGICKFYVIDAPLRETWAFPVRKRSPLKKVLNRASESFRENGLAIGIVSRYQHNWGMCDSEHRQSKFHPTITNASFCLLGLGLSVTCLILAMELAVRRWFFLDIRLISIGT